MYRRWRRRKKPKPGVHGRPPFPCTVDCRESEPAVKGSLRRAKLRRALDPRLRFPRRITEKRERGALGHSHSQLSYRATICQRSTGWSSLCSDCPKKTRFRMGHTICFEAGRFTQIQSSWTALCCSRKWMSVQSVRGGRRASHALCVSEPALGRTEGDAPRLGPTLAAGRRGACAPNAG